MPLTAGARLGSYEILAPLGAGGMGAVYRARDPKLRREVAIKVLPDETADDPGALVRFQREARAVAALSHPNILAIHDFGVADGVDATPSTELLQGETLRQQLAHGPVPVRRAIEIAREIALGLLGRAREGNRPPRPEAGQRLPDPGRTREDPRLRSRAQAPAAGATRCATTRSPTGPSRASVVGTTGYMSPEQIRGGPVDARSDIFSFGAMLYEMLSGQRAFRGDTSVETLNAILREDPPPLAEMGRAIPPVLERIVRALPGEAAGRRGSSPRATSRSTSGRSRSARRRTPCGSLPFRTGGGGGCSSREPAPPRWRWRSGRATPGADARRHSPSPVFRRLTFRRGTVQSARFAPDGKTVVYGAAWDGAPAGALLGEDRLDRVAPARARARRRALRLVEGRPGGAAPPGTAPSPAECWRACRSAAAPPGS